VFYSVVLEFDGMEIGLRQSSPSSLEAAYVDVHGTACLRGGAVSMLNRAKQLLSSLGLKLLPEGAESVSRLDVAIDLVGQDLRTFKRLKDRGRFIARAKRSTDEYERSECNGVYIRSEHSTLRVYNKLADPEAQGAKLELLVARWGGLPPAVTRVEFQSRGVHLRLNGIHSSADFVHRLPEWADWLTSKWCRLVTRVDRGNKHHSRAKLHPLWRRVRRALFGYLGESEGIKLVRPEHRGQGFLLRQALGCLASRCALQGRAVVSSADLEREVLNAVREAARGFDVLRVFRQKFGEAVVSGRQFPEAEAA